jgi:hypothetical protein
MQAFATPIMPGKLDAWRSWIDELKGARSADFAASNERHGLTVHHAWLQPNPADGSHLVVVVHDGPGADDYMGSLLKSDDPFDQWFGAGIAEAHGVDPTNPPPLPEQVI